MIDKTCLAGWITGMAFLNEVSSNLHFLFHILIIDFRKVTFFSTVTKLKKSIVVSKASPFNSKFLILGQDVTKCASVIMF